jgi:hypothetical protein
MRVKVRDLEPLHSARVSGNRPALRRLSDAELLSACNNPSRGDKLKISSRSGKVVDGNGRAYEFRRRLRSGSVLITNETEIECELYDSDLSMFPEL